MLSCQKKKVGYYISDLQTGEQFIGLNQSSAVSIISKCERCSIEWYDSSGKLRMSSNIVNKCFDGEMNQYLLDGKSTYYYTNCKIFFYVEYDKNDNIKKISRLNDGLPYGLTYYYNNEKIDSVHNLISYFGFPPGFVVNRMEPNDTSDNNHHFIFMPDSISKYSLFHINESLFYTDDTTKWYTTEIVINSRDTLRTKFISGFINLPLDKNTLNDYDIEIRVPYYYSKRAYQKIKLPNKLFIYKIRIPKVKFSYFPNA